MSQAAHAPGPAPAGGLTVTLVAFGLTRLLILATAMPVSLAFGPPLFGVDASVPRWLSVLGGWDTSWYIDIARHGYDSYSDLAGVIFTNLPFFPLLPEVMRAGLHLGLNPFLVGLAASNLGFVAALAGLHRLSRARYGEARARLVVWTTAAFPFTLYASLAYTEGITLALAVGAAILARRQHLLAASLMAGAASLARPTGVLVALLVALLAVQGVGDVRTRALRAATAFAPAVLAIAGYLAWMNATRGDWSLPLAAQAAWGRGQAPFGVVTTLPVEIARSIRGLLTLDLVRWWHPVVRDGVPTGLYAVLLWRLRRMEGSWTSPWVVYSAAVLAMPLSSGSFTSMTRFGLMAFPLAWPAADWIAHGGERRARRTFTAFAVLMAVCVAEMLIDAP